jgi:Na+/serine symporter
LTLVFRSSESLSSLQPVLLFLFLTVRRLLACVVIHTFPFCAKVIRLVLRLLHTDVGSLDSVSSTFAGQPACSEPGEMRFFMVLLSCLFFSNRLVDSFFDVTITRHYRYCFLFITDFQVSLTQFTRISSVRCAAITLIPFRACSTNFFLSF